MKRTEVQSTPNITADVIGSGAVKFFKACGRFSGKDQKGCSRGSVQVRNMNRCNRCSKTFKGINGGFHPGFYFRIDCPKINRIRHPHSDTADVAGQTGELIVNGNIPGAGILWIVSRHVSKRNT